MCRVLTERLYPQLSDVQRLTSFLVSRYKDLGIYDLESRYLATPSDAASTPFSSADFCFVPFKCDSESFGG